MEIDINEFFNRIKERSKFLKITQAQLCEKSGLNLNGFRNQINRNIAPSISDACKIAEALDVSLDWLCFGEDNKVPECNVWLALEKLSELEKILKNEK